MRRIVVVVALVSGVLLVPAVPASANNTTCRSERADVDARGKAFLDYLSRQHYEATKQFPQINPPRFEGALGACTEGAAKKATENGRAVRHPHSVSFRFTVVQLDGYAFNEGIRQVNATVVYTIKSTWNGRRYERVVLRPDGSVAVGGQDRGPVVIADPDPLRP